MKYIDTISKLNNNNVGKLNLTNFIKEFLHKTLEINVEEIKIGKNEEFFVAEMAAQNQNGLLRAVFDDVRFYVFTNEVKRLDGGWRKYLYENLANEEDKKTLQSSIFAYADELEEKWFQGK